MVRTYAGPNESFEVNVRLHQWSVLHILLFTEYYEKFNLLAKRTINKNKCIIFTGNS